MDDFSRMQARATENLDRAIAELRAKLGEDFEEEISDEEAARLWQMVDFSSFDDEEE